MAGYGDFSYYYDLLTENVDYENTVGTEEIIDEMLYIYCEAHGIGDAEEVFCVPISKNLSGSYAASVQAGEVYMTENPGRKVFTFDSLAVGPEMMMIVDKIRQLEAEGLVLLKNDGTLPLAPRPHSML